ncbi:MAG TPA: hypothetical protein VLF60_02070 [Candidatus Saccharimonadales bacterium]|nr:hypothetical protein [Candidatus Saccharimonadales bacterium]
MQHRIKRFSIAVVLGVACAGLIATALPRTAIAADDSGEFNLQVSPAALVGLVKPGQKTTLPVKIRNMGPSAEVLRIAPRSFTFDSKTQKLHLEDTQQPAIAPWISFSAPTFTIKPGEWFTQNVTLNVPKDAGFSYSFALVMNRVDTTKDQAQGGRVLKGSVALFTLVNVDRPGAVRKLDLDSFTSSKKVYEHLPTHFKLALKNTGNTIVQPAGNVFIQRHSHDKTPIDTLEVNANQGFILPDTTRDFDLDWEDGFYVTKTTTADDGSTKKGTAWNWNHLGNFRFGRYTAKLVAVYNDGHRDVPLEGEVTFWVIPWKILLGVLVVVLLIGFGIWSVVSKSIRFGKRIKRRR